MQSDTTITRFFGDRERPFTLTPPLIVELERATDTGLGLLTHRVIGMTYKHADLLHVIRLALIGGGETPQEAQRLVETFTTGRPVNEYFALAQDIVQAVMFGVPAEPVAPLEPAAND